MSWKIDPPHSEVNFIVRHMMISNVRGRFETLPARLSLTQPTLPTRRLMYKSKPIASTHAKPSAIIICARRISSMSRNIPTLPLKSKKGGSNRRLARSLLLVT